MVVETARRGERRGRQARPDSRRRHRQRQRRAEVHPAHAADEHSPAAGRYRRRLRPRRAPVGRCQAALRHSTRSLPDYREVLADPEIDLVLVLTSMQQHGEIARAALEAGKHVLVEKPMAMTLPEAAELVELARAQSRVSRLRAARRPQPDLSGDLAAPAAGRHRHGPQRARLLRLVGSELGAVVLSTRRRGDVRPRRLQRDHPHRSARPGAAGDGHERHRHPGAGGRWRADPGRHATTTRTCCSTSAMPATPWSPPGSPCSATRCPGSSSTAPRARSR